MQGQTKSTNPSLFDSIFNFVCPSGLEKLPTGIRTGTVYDIFFECTTDHIRVDMDITLIDGEEANDIAFINHAKFLPWVEKKGLLEMSTGTNHMDGGVCVKEEETAQIGYGEFLDDHLTEAILAEYMTEAGIVKHTFQLS